MPDARPTLRWANLQALRSQDRTKRRRRTTSWQSLKPRPAEQTTSSPCRRQRTNSDSQYRGATGYVVFREEPSSLRVRAERPHGRTHARAPADPHQRSAVCRALLGPRRRGGRQGRRCTSAASFVHFDVVDSAGRR